MAQLQEVFNRIQKAKKEQREIKAAYKDTLANSHQYQKISDELKNLKEKKRNIENDTKEEFSKDLTRYDDLKIDIDTDKEMLSDLAFNKLVKGETVEIIDENDNKYEPVFSVKFKKSW